MAVKWVKMIFPDHGVNRKVVDNVENYLNMKFQPKLMKRSRENGQKTSKTSFFDIKLLISFFSRDFCSKIWLRHLEQANLLQKAEKS